MTQEQQALQASLRDWAKRADPIAVTREASQEFLLTRCLSIAGGTTQILLTQVAERVLGLPR
jgi:hypothetical protein